MQTNIYLQFYKNITLYFRKMPSVAFHHTKYYPQCMGNLVIKYRDFFYIWKAWTGTIKKELNTDGSIKHKPQLLLY